MATTEQGPASEVLLFVEKDGPERFRIHSDQLEDIGAKLRGRARFSVFNSIVLPRPFNSEVQRADFWR